MEAARLTIRHKALSSAVSFSVPIFIEMLVWHTLYPFSIPLVYFARGKLAVINLRLLPVGKLYMFAFSLQTVSAVFFWTAVGCWAYTFAVSPTSRDASSGIESMMNFEALVLVVAVFFQKCAIATKWATVSSAQLRRLFSTTIPVQELNDEQLLTSWMNVSADTLEREMALAARDVLGMDAHAVGFTMAPLQRAALIEHLANMASTASGEEAADACGPLGASPDGSGSVDGSVASAGIRSRVAVVGRASSTNGTGTPAIARAMQASGMPAARASSLRVSASPMLVVRGGGSSSTGGAAPSGGRRPSVAGGKRRSLVELAGAAIGIAPNPADTAGDDDHDVVGDGGALRMRLDEEDARGADDGASAGGRDGDPGACTGGSAASPHVFVSAHWLAKMLFKRANVGATRMRDFLGRYAMLGGLAAAFLPMIVRGSYGLPVMGTTSVQRAFFTSALISQWFFSWVVVNYLRAAILDYRRRCNALRRLCTLCALPCGAVAGVSAMAAAAAPGCGVGGGNGVVFGSPVSSGGGPDDGLTSPTALLPRGVGGASTPQMLPPVSTSNLGSGGTGASGGGGVFGRSLPVSGVPPMHWAAGNRSESFIGIPVLDTGSALNPLSKQGELASGSPGSAASPLAAWAASSSSQQLSAQSERADGRAYDATGQLGWPVLTVDTSDNAMAFLFVRRLIISFGLRFHKRIQLYQGQALLLVVAIAVAMLTVLAVLPRTPSGLPALVSFGLQALLYLVMLTACILGCLWYGSQSNFNATDACALMAAKVLELRHRRVRATAARDGFAADGLMEAIHTIQEVSTCVEYDYKLDPVRILGFPASPALLQAVFAASASAASLAFKLLTSNNASIA